MLGTRETKELIFRININVCNYTSKKKKKKKNRNCAVAFSLKMLKNTNRNIKLPRTSIKLSTIVLT